jgi:hypothetical protein
MAGDHWKMSHSDHSTYRSEELSRVKQERFVPGAEDRERRYRVQSSFAFSVSHISYTQIPTAYTSCTAYRDGMGEGIFRLGESGH